MDEKELEQYFEAFKKHIEDLGADFEALHKNMTADKGEAKARKHIAELGKALESTTKSLKKSEKDISDAIKHLKKQVDEETISLEGFEDSLVQLRKEIKNTSDVTKKQSLLEQKYDLERMNASMQATTIFKNSLMSLGGTVIAGVGNSFKQASLSALRGGDALDVAGSFMSAQIDMANNATQVGAGALMEMGKATMGAGGKVGAFGVAATIAGTAISFLSNQMSELAKAGIGFMITQTKKLTDGFMQMSSAGAIYSGGMMQMIETSHKAGMTLEQFSKAVSENKDALTKSGLGVAEGSKKMAGAMVAGGKSARDGMFALGMSMNEQAEAYAQTMANMAGPSGKLKASNQEVAQQTAEYAKNLKLLSDLTGEDMKSKQEQIRSENDTLAFQQQLDGMSEKERANIVESMKGMSEIQRKALRERMIYGSVISKDAAIAEATNSGIRKSGEEFAGAVRNHTLTLDKTLEIQGRNSDETHRQAMDNKALAMSQNADAQAAAAAQLKTDQLTRKLSEARTEEEKKKLRTEIAAGKTGKRPEIEVMQIQQDFAVKMEDIAKNNLPKFAAAISKTISEIEKAVASIANLGAEAPSMFSGLLAQLGIALIGGLAPILATSMGKMFGKPNGPVEKGIEKGLEKGSKAAAVGSALKQNKAGQWIDAKTGRYASKAVVAEHMAGGKAASAGASKVAGMAHSAETLGETAKGGLGGSIAKLGEGLGTFIKAVGAGGGSAIASILTGFATGMSAVGAAAPEIVLGAGAIALAIPMIGAGIAGAAWIMGKALPTFAEGLDSLASVDGKNLIDVGLGMIGLGAGFAAFGAGAAIGGALNLVGNIIEALPGKSPLQKLKEFGELDINGDKVKGNAEAFVAFSNAMASYKGTGQGVLGAIGERVASFFRVKVPYDQVSEFSKQDFGPNAEKNAKAFAAFAQGLNAFNSAGAGNVGVFTAINKGINSFFEVKPPVQQLKEFSNENLGPNAEKNAKAFAAFAQGLLAFKNAGGGNIGAWGAISQGMNKFFTVKPPVQQLKEFSAIDLKAEKVKTNAEAFVAFSNALSAYKGTSQGIGSVIADGLNSLFGQPLPLDQLRDFQKEAFDGKVIKDNADAFVAFGNALSAYKGTGTGIGAALASGLNSLFGTKLPLDEIKEFQDAGFDPEKIKARAEALVALSNALNSFKVTESGGNLAKLGVNLHTFLTKVPQTKLAAAPANITAFSKSLPDLAKGLKEIQSIDSDKLDGVAESMKKITDSMPSPTQMIAASLTGLWDNLTGAANNPANAKAETKAPGANNVNKAITKTEPALTKSAELKQPVNAPSSWTANDKKTADKLNKQNQNALDDLDDRSKYDALGRPITKHAKGGTIKAGRLGIVGDAGPEIVQGPAEVTTNKATERIISSISELNKLTAASLTQSKIKIKPEPDTNPKLSASEQATLKLVTALDAVREMQGERFGENDFQAQVSMNADRWPVLENRIKDVRKPGQSLDDLRADLEAKMKKDNETNGSKLEEIEKQWDKEEADTDTTNKQLAATMQQHTELLTQMVTALSKNNSLTSGILHNSY